MSSEARSKWLRADLWLSGDNDVTVSFVQVTVYIERLQFFGFRIFEQVGNFLYTGYVISNEKMLEDFIADQNIAQ